jgi:hypothetical protein
VILLPQSPEYLGLQACTPGWRQEIVEALTKFSLDISSLPNVQQLEYSLCSLSQKAREREKEREQRRERENQFERPHNGLCPIAKHPCSQISWTPWCGEEEAEDDFLRKVSYALHPEPRDLSDLIAEKASALLPQVKLREVSIL